MSGSGKLCASIAAAERCIKLFGLGFFRQHWSNTIFAIEQQPTVSMPEPKKPLASPNTMSQRPLSRAY